MNQCNLHPANNSIRRRGFATIFAISLIIMVGSALVAMSAYFAMDATRTRTQAQDAQLRQLLTAGAIAAIDRADSLGKTSLDLPSDLNGASVSIEIIGTGDSKKAVITAAFNQRRSLQTLTLHRNATGEKAKWSIVAAELDSVAQPPAATQPSDRSTAASQRS